MIESQGKSAERTKFSRRRAALSLVEGRCRHDRHMACRQRRSNCVGRGRVSAVRPFHDAAQHSLRRQNISLERCDRRPPFCPAGSHVTKVSQLWMVPCVTGWPERLIGLNLPSAPPGFPRLLQLLWVTPERKGGAAELTHKRYAAALGGFVRRRNPRRSSVLRCGTLAARRGR